MNGARAGLARALSRKRWTAGAFVLGLALRIAALALLARVPLAGNARTSFEMAGRLLDGARFAPEWPPGVPYYIAVFSAFLGRAEVVAMAAMLLWYVAFSALLFALVMRIAGRRAANIALSVFAVYPTFVYHSVVPLAQLPIAVCLLLVAHLVLALRGRRSLAIPAGIGVALAACVLMWPEAVLLALGVPVFILVRWRAVKGFLVALGVAAALVVPWVVKVHSMTGDLVFVEYTTSRSAYLGNSPWTPLYRTWSFGSADGAEAMPAGLAKQDSAIRALPPSKKGAVFSRLAIQGIEEHPGRFAIRTLNRVRAYFAFDTYAGSALLRIDKLPRALGASVGALDVLFYIALMALSLVAFHAPRGLRTARVTRATLLWVVAGYAVPCWVSLCHPAHHIPVVPLLAVPAAALLAQMLGMEREVLVTSMEKLRHRRSIGIAIAVFLAVQVEWAIATGIGFLGRG